MLQISGNEAEQELLLIAAKLMLDAARTAPKSHGKDDILTALLSNYGE